jgi:hypothetical protein
MQVVSALPVYICCCRYGVVHAMMSQNLCCDGTICNDQACVYFVGGVSSGDWRVGNG